VQIDAGHESIPAANTTIYFYNNTIYGCGWGQGANGAGASGCVCITNLSRYTLKFCNNIIVSTGEPYIAGWSDQSISRRDGHNLWYGKMPGSPLWDSTAITGDPKFADTANANLRLLTGSPAINAGLTTGFAVDFDAVTRPQGSGYDLGAYEFIDGSTVEFGLAPMKRNNAFVNRSYFSFSGLVEHDDANAMMNPTQLFTLAGKAIPGMIRYDKAHRGLQSGMYVIKIQEMKR
jgi:hypothetical protein